MSSLSSRYFPADASNAVLIWWLFLTTVSLFNLAAWIFFARRGIPASRRWQLRLSLTFVVVCGFRSFLPRADVQRICLVDSWLSSVLVGRAVATIAELAFMAQWALMLREFATDLDARFALTASRLILPFIAFAEICSWYAVVTTSYIGNTLEESTWALTAAMAIAAALTIRPRLSSGAKALLAIAIALGVGYVAFMFTVDIPMYFTRWRADEAAGRSYLSLAQGLHDLSTRWIVTYRWEDWHEELAWMALYFSVAVWSSIALISAPRAVRSGFR